MNKKLKAILIAISLIILIGLAGYYYIMYSGIRDLTTEKTEYSVTSAAVTSEFEKNPEAANKKYLEKAIAIKGTITAVSANDVMIDNIVNCNLKEPDLAAKPNQAVTIKGRVIGYDDLMGELKLDQCFIIKN